MSHIQKPVGEDAAFSNHAALQTVRKDYQILIPRSTWDKATRYFDNLRAMSATGQATNAGRYFATRLEKSGIDVQGAPESAFHYAMMRELINTKKPQIYAEMQIKGRPEDDWSQEELHILGDIAIAVPVTIYDDGNHDAHEAKVHSDPFQGTLLYVPGALLRNDNHGFVACDLPQVAVQDGHGEWHIDPHALNKLYKRRLLPSLLYANAVCKAESKKGFITVPGLGCGQFAGPFKGRMGKLLQGAIEDILQNYKDKLPYIKAIYYDPYSECKESTREYDDITFMVRPLRKMPKDKRKCQLHPPQDYNEDGLHFADCLFFSFVAWDHVSWPGNDFWIGERQTDDGVKAAATNSMGVMTGIQGYYDPSHREYLPPANYSGWIEVVDDLGLQMDVTENGNVVIYEEC
jgi:hypothetical protein